MRTALSVAVICMVLTASVKGECSALLEAKEAVTDHRYQKAVQLLQERRLLKIDRDEGCHLLGRARFLQKRYADAIKVLNRHLRDFPKSPWKYKSLFLKAECLSRRKDFKGADEIYAKALKRLTSAERREAVVKLFLDYADRHFSPKEKGEAPNYYRALKFYRLSKKVGLSRKQVFRVEVSIGQCLYKQKLYWQAIRHYVRVLRKYRFKKWKKHLAETKFYAGLSNLKGNNYFQARRLFEDLIADYPGSPFRARSSYQLSRTYRIPKPRNEKDLELGVKQLKRFIHLHPAHKLAAKADFEVGLSYFNFNRYADAVRAFEGYVSRRNTEKKVKELGRAKYYIGLCKARQKRYGEARAAFNRYLSDHPAGSHAIEAQKRILSVEFDMAEADYKDKRYKEAARAYEAYMIAYPLDARTPRAALRLAQVQEKQKDYRAAERYFKRARSKYQGQNEGYEAAYRLGQLYEMKLGDYVKAMKAYKKVLSGTYYHKARKRLRTLKKPLLEVLTKRIFGTGEKAGLKVSTRNIKKLTFEAYRVDLETYFRKTQTTAHIEDLDIALIAPDIKWEVKTSGYVKHKIYERNIPLKLNRAGVYAVTVSGGKLNATAVVHISDLAMVTKTTRKEVFVFALNTRQSKPASGVKVLISDGRKVIDEGLTDSRGIYQKRHRKFESASKLNFFAARRGSYGASTLPLQGMSFVRELEARGYVYTDRTAYLPGQEVGIRGIVRRAERGSYLYRKGEQYTLTVVDEGGRLVMRKKVRLDAFGAFSVKARLKRGAALGQYQVVVTRLGVQTFRGRFRVDRFKLDKIQLALKTNHAAYLRGEELKATVEAKYYFGAPVRNKKVVLQLANEPPLMGMTDARGRFKATFKTRRYGWNQLLKLRANLPSEGVRAQKAVRLSTEGFQATVSTLRKVYLAGEEIHVKVKTRDVRKKPLGRLLRLQALRVVHTDGKAVEREEYRAQVRTSPGNGEGAVKIRFGKGGKYILRVRGYDRSGMPVTAERHLFVSGKEDKIKLRLFAERQSYLVGETARVKMIWRRGRAPALITYEGEGVLRSHFIHLEPGENHHRIPLKDRLSPNFTLAVAVLKGNTFDQAKKAFTVLKGLKIALLPEKKTYRPGEEVKVRIKTTDRSGKAVKAALSLAVVDRALYARYPDRLPSLRDFFYRQRRGMQMKTASSNTFKHKAVVKKISEIILAEKQRRMEEWAQKAAEKEKKSGYADKLQLIKKKLALLKETVFQPLKSEKKLYQFDDGIMGGHATGQGGSGGYSISGKTMAVRGYGGRVYGRSSIRNPSTIYSGYLSQLREYFPETAYWNPSIETDQRGEATITFRLPDSTTTWRLTARGVTADTLVGQARGKVVAKKDFFADLTLPQILTEGDRVRLRAVAHNLGAARTARLRLESKLGHRSVVKEKAVVLKKMSATELIFDKLDLKGVHAKEAELKLQMAVQSGPPAQADHQIRRIPIRPWGSETRTGKSGKARGDADIRLDLGSGDFTRQELNITVGPFLSRVVVDSAKNFGGRYWASSSQAAARALAVAAAVTYLRASGQTQSGEHRLLFNRLKGLVETLKITQRSSGGWNWFGKQRATNGVVSAQALRALAMARELGIETARQAEERAFSYVFRRYRLLPSYRYTYRSLLLRAMAASKPAHREVFSAVNRLYRLRSLLKKRPLAELALSLVAMGRKAEAMDIAARLAAKIGAADFSLTGPSRFGRKFYKLLPYCRGRITRMAVMMDALQRALKQHALVERLGQWLLKQRRGHGWNSRRATSAAIEALSFYFAKTRPRRQRYDLAIWVNGRQVKKLRIRGGSPSLQVAVPPRFLKKGVNLVAFKVEGRAEYAYVATLKGFIKGIDKSHRNRYIKIERTYQRAPLVHDGKRISRGFSTLTGKYKKWKNPLKHLPLGGRANVELSLKAKWRGNQGYLKVEEPLPSGCTVPKESIKGIFDHYELLPGKLVFYLSNRRYLGKLKYDLYGMVPGRYGVLPTRISSPYVPSYYSTGKPYQLVVLGPGEKKSDPYRMTPDELYYLGKALYQKERYEKAERLLTKLFKAHPKKFSLSEGIYKDTARMLLYTSLKAGQVRRVVTYFEILKEKHPELVIPFDKIVAIGQAYRKIGEYERALMVFKATAEGLFLKESRASGHLDREGELKASINYVYRLLRDYPDLPTTQTALYTMSQLIFSKAAEAKSNEKLRKQGLTEKVLLAKTVGLLKEFLSLYPESPMADEASFSLASAYLRRDQNRQVVAFCRKLDRLFKKSDYLDHFHYLKAFAHFGLREYGQALKLCRRVARELYPGKSGVKRISPNRDQAIYVMGQIHHAQGNPGQSLKAYNKVKHKFPDAREAISYFQRKALKLKEINIVRAGESAAIKLKFRNVAKVRVLAYKVDLMKLYLLKKNLNAITKINLAGIKPYHDRQLVLGAGRDYRDRTRTIHLPLRRHGAYLVVAKSKEKSASGMVLRTNLNIEVQEAPGSGRVRVNVYNKARKRYVSRAFVRVVGSKDGKFRSGYTDLRGVFIADGIKGKATVIVAQGGQYAFHRGAQLLLKKNTYYRPSEDKPASQKKLLLNNLEETQQNIQRRNYNWYKSNIMFNDQSGVRIKALE